MLTFQQKLKKQPLLAAYKPLKSINSEADT